MFIELSLYPLLVGAAEKITNDMLPVYDRRSPDSLIGAFDDIRPIDRDLVLREQQAEERVATIDEIREKYYQRSRLPRGRGELLTSDSPPSPMSEQQTMPNLLRTPIKAAQLREDEQSLLALLRDQNLDAAGLRSALMPAIGAAMGAAAAPYNVNAPVAEWSSAWVDAVAPTLLAAIKEGPGPGNDWSWLGRMVVGLITRAKAWAVEQLQGWFGSRGDDRQLVWSTMGDEKVCQQCQALEGTPKDDLPSEIRPGGLHPFCRCGWVLQQLMPFTPEGRFA